MLRHALIVLAFYFGSAATVFAAGPLNEVRKSFTIGGRPIPPEIFADFSDAMMSDSRPIVVTIDANAAIDSNRYADPIKTNGRWVEQMRPGSGSFNGPETMSYEYRGATSVPNCNRTGGDETRGEGLMGKTRWRRRISVASAKRRRPRWWQWRDRRRRFRK
jgi:hypothetical protein